MKPRRHTFSVSAGLVSAALRSKAAAAPRRLTDSLEFPREQVAFRSASASTIEKTLSGLQLSSPEPLSGRATDASTGLPDTAQPSLSGEMNTEPEAFPKSAHIETGTG